MTDNIPDAVVTEAIPDAVVTEPIPAEQPPNTPTPTHLITNTQAGAEWNLFYYDPSGFDCHLKLHATSGLVVLDLAAAAMLKLVERGCIPKNGAPAQPATEPTREDQPRDGTASATYCTDRSNRRRSTRRREKDGDVW